MAQEDKAEGRKQKQDEHSPEEHDSRRRNRRTLLNISFIVSFDKK